MPNGIVIRIELNSQKIKDLNNQLLYENNFQVNVGCG
jgi:hypothetical protein